MRGLFGHGQLRLYLLHLLREQPRTGYDVIRLLEENSLGLYAPSTGTVYPRLHRLEAEGLVHREPDGSRYVYSLTRTGRLELDRRQDELAALQEQLQARRRELAGQLGEQAAISADQIRDELDRAAARLRREQRKGLGVEVSGAVADLRENLRQVVRRRRFQQLDRHRDQRSSTDRGASQQFERQLVSFAMAVQTAAGTVTPSAAQLEVCAAILADTLERIEQALRG